MNINLLHHHLATYPAAVSPSLRGFRPQLTVQTFDTLASTNQTLWEMARQGANAGTVVLAQQQTAGRGQRGKQWVSDPGGIYLSMLLEPDWESSLAPRLTFSSSWGIATLLRQWQLPIAIKWPNDLVVKSAHVPGRLLKLGGILTETRTEGEKLSQAIVGVGLNYANHNIVTTVEPQSATTLATLLENRQTPVDWSLEFAIATVLMGIWQGLCWQQQVGIDAFMQSYERLLAHLGQIIDIDGQPAQVIGATAGGRLKVRLFTSKPAQPKSTQPVTAQQIIRKVTQDIPQNGPGIPLSVQKTEHNRQTGAEQKVMSLSTEQVSLGYNVAGLN